NGIDNLFHLNVAKSSISIPFGERFGFARYVRDLKTEAEKEFFNLEVKGTAAKAVNHSLFRKVPTTNEISLSINEEFPILKELAELLDMQQQQKLKVILRLVETAVNKIRNVHVDEDLSGLIEKNAIAESGLDLAI